jgi:hypothetical protein
MNLRAPGVMPVTGQQVDSRLRGGGLDLSAEKEAGGRRR